MLPKTPNVSQLQKKTPRTTNRDHAYEQKVWNDLQRKIKGAVEATAARSKPFNGQNDRDRVAVRVDEALDILRPMILGGALLHLPLLSSACCRIDTNDRLGIRDKPSTEVDVKMS